MSNPAITIERRGAAAWLTLALPQIGVAAIRELREASESLADDAGVRAVVLSGSGGGFANGWDAELLSDVGVLRRSGALSDPFGCLAELSKPVIAAVSAHDRPYRQLRLQNFERQTRDKRRE